MEGHFGDADFDDVAVVENDLAVGAGGIDEGSATAAGIADVKRVSVAIDPGVDSGDDALAELNAVERLSTDQNSM